MLNEIDMRCKKIEKAWDGKPKALKIFFPFNALVNTAGGGGVAQRDCPCSRAKGQVCREDTRSTNRGKENDVRHFQSPLKKDEL